MARTESVSFQVHPNDEQSQIGLMEKFHWNLLNSQEIKTVDSHLERRGDSLYSVTQTSNYVKLVFQRSLDLPNIDRIKALEQEHTALTNERRALPYPSKPGLIAPVPVSFLGSWIAGIVAQNAVGPLAGDLVFLGGGATLSALWLRSNIRKRGDAVKTYAASGERQKDIDSRVAEIFAEVGQL